MSLMLNSFLRRRAEAMSWARLAVTRRGTSPFKTRALSWGRRLRSGDFFLSSSAGAVAVGAGGWALGAAPFDGSLAASGLAPGSAAGGLVVSEGTDGTDGAGGVEEGLDASGAGAATSFFAGCSPSLGVSPLATLSIFF